MSSTTTTTRRTRTTSTVGLVLSFVVVVFLLLCKESEALVVSSTPTTTATMTSSVLTSIGTAEEEDRSFGCPVIVVGGGPIGLATALTLAKPPHSQNVIVLEKTVGTQKVTNYDVTKSYLYNVNARGLVWFREMEARQQSQSQSIFDQLATQSVAPTTGMGAFLVIPGNPNVPIDTSRIQKPTPSIAPNIPVANRTSFWIPRHEMVQVLENACMQHNHQKQQQQQQDPSKSSLLGSIQLFNGKEVIDMTTNNNKEHEQWVTLHCSDGTHYTGSFIVAADGIDSKVRACLAQTNTHNTTTTTTNDPRSSSSSSFWFHNDPVSSPKTFRIRKYKSPATGLTLKALQFPPNFTIPLTANTGQPSTSETIYSFRGVHTGPLSRFSIGMLPMKNPNSIRPGNVIVRPRHEVLQQTSGVDMKRYFETNFPRLQSLFTTDISMEEWERFTNAQGTRFPYCQYSPGNAITSPNGKVGIVLVGDACHAFPPDIGQGINAGLQDVVALDRSLRGCDIETGETKTNHPLSTQKQQQQQQTSSSSLLRTAIVEEYQKNRSLEHQSLIRLARFGSPYQYRQSYIRDRIGRMLWTLNVLFRMILHKVSMNRIPPSAIVLVNSKPEYSYYQVMKRCDRTTLLLLAFVGATALSLWKQSLGRWLVPKFFWGLSAL